MPSLVCHMPLEICRHYNINQRLVRGCITRQLKFWSATQILPQNPKFCRQTSLLDNIITRSKEHFDTPINKDNPETILHNDRYCNGDDITKHQQVLDFVSLGPRTTTFDLFVLVQIQETKSTTTLEESRTTTPSIQPQYNNIRMQWRQLTSPETTSPSIRFLNLFPFYHVRLCCFDHKFFYLRAYTSATGAKETETSSRSTCVAGC